MEKLNKGTCLILVLLLIVFISTISFTEERQSIGNDYTMGEIEKILEEYLEENHSNIEIGSNEYVNYLIIQLMEDADKELV